MNVLIHPGQGCKACEGIQSHSHGSIVDTFREDGRHRERNRRVPGGERCRPDFELERSKCPTTFIHVRAASSKGAFENICDDTRPEQ